MIPLPPTTPAPPPLPLPPPPFPSLVTITSTEIIKLDKSVLDALEPYFHTHLTVLKIISLYLITILFGAFLYELLYWMDGGDTTHNIESSSYSVAILVFLLVLSFVMRHWFINENLSILTIFLQYLLEVALGNLIIIVVAYNSTIGTSGNLLWSFVPLGGTFALAWFLGICFDCCHHHKSTKALVKGTREEGKWMTYEIAKERVYNFSQVHAQRIFKYQPIRGFTTDLPKDDPIASTDDGETSTNDDDDGAGDDEDEDRQLTKALLKEAEQYIIEYWEIASQLWGLAQYFITVLYGNFQFNVLFYLSSTQPTVNIVLHGAFVSLLLGIWALLYALKSHWVHIHLLLFITLVKYLVEVAVGNFLYVLVNYETTTGTWFNVLITAVLLAVVCLGSWTIGFIKSQQIIHKAITLGSSSLSPQRYHSQRQINKYITQTLDHRHLKDYGAFRMQLPLLESSPPLYL